MFAVVASGQSLTVRLAVRCWQATCLLVSDGSRSRPNEYGADENDDDAGRNDPDHKSEIPHI